MNEDGFIKLHRKIISWSWYKDSKVKALFIHCLLKANYQDGQWHNISVKRGSFLTSISHLAEETGLTIKEVRRALEELTEAKCLLKTSTAKYTLVTVINYDEYQGEGKEEGKVQKAENPHECRGSKGIQHQKGQGKGQSEGKPPGKEKGKVKGKVKTGGEPHQQCVSDTSAYTGGQSKGHDKGQSEGKVRATNKKEKKYLSPLRETDTADTPACPEGGVRVPPEQEQPTMPTGGLVPVKEILAYAYNNALSGGTESVWEFYSGFERSGTAMPPEWQELYERYVAADGEHRRQFIDLLMSGKLRERWGCT